VPAFSIHNFAELCSVVPWAVWQEVPDAHPSNQRKTEKTMQLLPENGLGVKNSCMCHQAHRAIASREPGCSGDVHAITVTTSGVHNTNKIHNALWHLIFNTETCEYTIEAPDPELEVLHKDILVHTLLRSSERVVSTADPKRLASSLDMDIDSPAHRFLKRWNGNWNLPRLVTHDQEGRLGQQKAREAMFASAVEVDLLLASERLVPSMDDWGSCGEATGRVTLGILVHGILLQCLDIALPDWNSMLPPGARRPASDSATHERARLQKKAWRSKCVLRDYKKCANIMIYNYLGTPVEHLMRELDAIDERTSGLLNMYGRPSLNPSLVCQSSLCRLLCFGFDQVGSLPDFGALLPLLKWAQANTASDLDNPQQFLVFEWWGVGLDIASQVFWRNLHLSAFPFKFVKGALPMPLGSAVDIDAMTAHGLVSGPHETEAAQKLAPRYVTSRSFFEEAPHKCCRDPNFGDKVHHKHARGTVQESAVALTRDDDFWRLINIWGKFVFKFTNMCQERALAAIQRGSRASEKLEAERVCATGILRFALQEHLALGRRDPRAVTRSQVIEAGVPIRAVKAKATPMPKKRRCFILYKKEMEAKRKQIGARMKNKAYKRWLRLLGKDFRTLPETEAAALQRRVDNDVAQQVVAEEEKVAAEKEKVKVLG